MKKPRAVRDLADPALHPGGRADPPSQVLPGLGAADFTAVAAAVAALPGIDEIRAARGDTHGVVSLRWEVLAALDTFLRSVAAVGVTPKEAGFLTEAHVAILAAVAGRTA